MTQPPQQPPPGPWQPSDQPYPTSATPASGGPTSGGPWASPTTPIPGAAYPMPPTQPFAAPDPQQPYPQQPYPAPPYQPYPGQPPMNPPPAYGPPQEYASPGKGGKSNKTLIAVIAGAAALLLIGAVSAVALFLRSSDKPTTPLAQPSSATASSAAPASAQPSPSPSAEASPSTGNGTGTGSRKIVYEVTGKGKGTITYSTTTTGEVKQLENQKLPWRYEFTTGDDAALNVSGIADFTGDAKLTCRILVDGKEVAKESGGFAMCVNFDY